MASFFAQQFGVERCDHVAHDAWVGYAVAGMETRGLAVDVLRRRPMGKDPVILAAPRQILDVRKDLAPFDDANSLPRNNTVPEFYRI